MVYPVFPKIFQAFSCVGWSGYWHYTFLAESDRILPKASTSYLTPSHYLSCFCLVTRCLGPIRICLAYLRSQELSWKLCTAWSEKTPLSGTRNRKKSLYGRYRDIFSEFNSQETAINFTKKNKNKIFCHVNIFISYVTFSKTCSVFWDKSEHQFLDHYRLVYGLYL